MLYEFYYLRFTELCLLDFFSRSRNFTADELIKVAQALLKPINHVVDDTHDIYWITDGVTCYQYQVVRESSSVTKGTDGS